MKPRPSAFRPLLVVALAFELLSGTALALEAACTDCGVVIAVAASEQTGKATGLGAVAGGIGGALLGNQVGKGRGKTVATVAGAAGGAYAGHQIEKSMNSAKTWNVQVKMDNGDTRAFSYTTEPTFHQGDKVQVRDGQLVLRAN